VRALQDAYRKAEASSPRDNAPSAGQIRNLGLINKDDESKELLGS
jgi:NADH dehydrogenase (ubiquinone) Fe-S protein 5